MSLKCKEEQKLITQKNNLRNAKSKSFTLPFIKMIRIRQSLNKKYIELDGLETKVVSYELSEHKNGISESAIWTIKEFITVKKVEVIRPSLLSFEFLEGMSERLKPLSYFSPSHQFLFGCLEETLGKIIQISSKEILIGQGETSENYYAFFHNCLEQPFSMCCNRIIYIRTQIIAKPTKNNQFLSMSIVDELLNEIYCSNCYQLILELSGQKSTSKSCLSEKKTKHLIEKSVCKKKINLSVMIGSGKFTKFKLDNLGNSKLLSQEEHLNRKLFRSLDFINEKNETSPERILTKSVQNKKK